MQLNMSWSDSPSRALSSAVVVVCSRGGTGDSHSPVPGPPLFGGSVSFAHQNVNDE